MKHISLSILIIALIGIFQLNGNAQNQSAETEVTTVKVKGIGCADDVKTIKLHISKLTGVKTCEVTKKGATTSYKVEFDPSAVKLEEIHLAIEDTPGCKNPNARPYKVKKPKKKT